MDEIFTYDMGSTGIYEQSTHEFNYDVYVLFDSWVCIFNISLSNNGLIGLQLWTIERHLGSCRMCV